VQAESSRRRSRGPQVADAVLDATLALLAERAYSFSVEDVARSAHVHKTTIYRRYTTKAALVGAAIERMALAQIPVPESGDALEDLAALAGAVARVLSSPAGARVIRAVVAAASDDPEVLTVARRFLAGRFDAAAKIVGRAISSGQVRAGTDAVLLWGAIVNPLHVRALLGHPASESTARDLVALVLDGARTTPVR
jgi:AcrR family transcriptional regulator